MPSTYSDQLRVELIANGEASNVWGDKTNTNLELLESSISGMSSIASTGGDTTLTTVNGGDDQARHSMLKITGTLVSDANIIIPARTKHYLVWNATSGAFSVTVKASGGAGAVVSQGGKQWVFCDATDTYAVEVPISSGVSGLGTGVATFLATPSSANLRAAVTDETGTGNLVFQGGDLGTPSAAVLTNATGTAASLVAGSATAALGLKTATNTVAVSASAAPVAGNVLTATGATTAAWQALAGAGLGDMSGPASAVVGNVPVFDNISGKIVADSGKSFTDVLETTDIGVSVQAYDADTAKYGAATANFTGTLQNGGSNVVVDTDIGSTVQAYSAAPVAYKLKTATTEVDVSAATAPTVGQALIATSSTTAAWSAAKISNIVTATTATTLTSTPTLLQITPTTPAPGPVTDIDGSYPQVVMLTATTGIKLFQNSVTATTVTAQKLSTTNMTFSANTTVATGATAGGVYGLAALTSTTAFVTYVVGGTVKARIIDASGDTLTTNTEYTGASTGNDWIEATALSATSVLVVYRQTTGNYPVGVIATISGTTITFNTPSSAVIAADCRYFGLATLSSTSAIFGFQDTVSGTQKCAVCTVSGTTITWGTPVQVDATATSWDVSMATLSSTLAIAVYNVATAGATKAVCISVSGTVPTINTAITLDASYGVYPSVTALSATKAFCTYGGGTGSYILQGRVLDVSGVTITAGSVVLSSATGNQWTHVSAIFGGSDLFEINTRTSTQVMEVRKITVSGTSISQLMFNSSGVFYSPYGVTVTLPDATTCTEGGPLHIIDNKGAYPVRVANSAGTLLGFIYGGIVSHVSLIDNATAAGVWSVENSELVGASAQLLTTVINTVRSCLAIDADREFLLTETGAGNIYGVVYNKTTNAFGSPTLIRAVSSGGSVAVLAGTDKVLVVSCTSGTTAFEAVILSISGTTITVNTAATATLSANISAFADGCGLIAVGSDFVTSYTVATPAAQIRALSVSGTTVTIGAATVLDGTAGGLIAASDDKVIAVSAATTNFYTKPYTVSGSTLSAGTGTTTAAGGTVNLGEAKLAPLGTRWFTTYRNVTPNLFGAIISLSGTTTTISTATVFASAVLQDAIIVGSNKVLLINGSSSNNANILTDTAGTASAGTAITLDSNTSRACLYADGTDVVVQSGTAAYSVHVVDCSGASPIRSKTICTSGQTSSTYSSVFDGSNSVLTPDAEYIRGAAFAQTITNRADERIMGMVRAKDDVFTLLPYRVNTIGYTAYRGKADSERWITDVATVITKVECVA